MEKLPPIGLRIIKSASAVFICLLIGYYRRGGIPFYSAIAAILCMQPDVQNSLKVGLNRIVGTLTGGLFGMVMLILMRRFLPDGHDLFQYFIISASIILLMYITVLMHKTSATYITCVVYLSTVITHGADLMPYTFALNRIVDTLIGIFVAIVINSIPVLQKKELAREIALERAEKAAKEVQEESAEDLNREKEEK